jgi:hypothetical protein
VKDLDLEVHGLTTLTLAVEETATVGDEAVLTTSDALPQEPELVAAAVPAATTTECGCSADDVLNVLSQAESVQMNSLNVVSSLQLNGAKVATESYADQCRCTASDLGLDGAVAAATATTECGCSDTEVLAAVESASSLRLQTVVANSYTVWVDSDTQVVVPDQRDLDNLENDLRSAMSGLTASTGDGTCSCTADDIAGMGFTTGGCDCDLSEYVTKSDFSQCACLPPE